MSISTLEIIVNTRKELFIRLLKQQGVYLYHCKVRGFVYEMTHSIYGKNSRLTISMKDGCISVLSMDIVTDSVA